MSTCFAPRYLIFGHGKSLLIDEFQTSNSTSFWDALDFMSSSWQSMWHKDDNNVSLDNRNNYFLEFSQINAERDKERHHLDELNRRLNCQIENLESQKEKMNSDLHTLTIENEKHKEDLKKLKTQIKNLKNEITIKSDKETQTDLSANQIEGKALAKKDQFITWLKNDNDFLNDEKNKLSDLVVELETHLGKFSIDYQPQP